MSLPRSFAFLALGLASAAAQPPPVPGLPPGVPMPEAVPQPPAGGPAARQVVKEQAVVPGATLGETKIPEDINEPKLTGNALADLYTYYTGRRVIVSSAASAAEFSFVQKSDAKNPLTFAKAAELLKKAATIENFIFLPDGTDPNLDFLMLPTGVTNPKNRGVGVYTENGPVYSETDALPEGDAVISYVMQLNYIKPVDAQNVFTQIIGQFGSYGSIAPVANASSLIITENTSLIRKLIDLKKEIDKPGSVQGTRFIKVQYADVTEIADTLTTLLTAQQTGQKTAGIQRADSAPVPGVPQVPGQAAAGGGGAGEESPVQIVPDPRTNRIFAMGRPVDLLFVEGLVREFDVETSEKNFLRRKLRFLTVSDFLPIAGDALTRAFSGTGDSGGASAQGGGASRSGQSGATGGGSRTQSAGRSSNSSSGANFGGSTSGSGSSFGGSGGSSGGGGGGGTGNALSDPEVSSAPESILVGRTLLVADNITNSIVVQGPPSGLEIIERLLDQIDVKPDQVMISTVIGQLSLGDSKEFGVNYLLKSDGFRLGGGGNNDDVIGGTTTDPDTGEITGTPEFPRFNPSKLGIGGGLRALGTIGDLGIYLKALQSKSDFTVLSRPSIFTSNNQKGTISSGERIAIPTGTNNSGNFSSTNIEYQNVVLKLEVIPLVNSDNEITMKIALLNDELSGSEQIEGVGKVPTISTREILTTATVPNGQTIVLGGLIVGRKDTSISGIPILSDIPYLGKLFSTTTNSDTRSELMVFIQPSVVNSDRSLNSVQADMDARYKVSEKAHQVADGLGVLPNVDAIQPVADKGGSRPVAAPRSIQAPTYETPSSSTLKPSVRPAFRR